MQIELSKNYSNAENLVVRKFAIVTQKQRDRYCVLEFCPQLSLPAFSSLTLPLSSWGFSFGCLIYIHQWFQGLL